MKFIKKIEGESFFKKNGIIIRVGKERWTKSIFSWFAQEVKMNNNFTDIAKDFDGISWGAKGKIIAQANTKKELLNKINKQG